MLEAKNKGMKLDQPSIVTQTEIKVNLIIIFFYINKHLNFFNFLKKLDTTFVEASKRKFQFILAIHSDASDDIHSN